MQKRRAAATTYENGAPPRRGEEREPGAGGAHLGTGGKLGPHSRDDLVTSSGEVDGTLRLRAPTAAGRRAPPAADQGRTSGPKPTEEPLPGERGQKNLRGEASSHPTPLKYRNPRPSATPIRSRAGRRARAPDKIGKALPHPSALPLLPLGPGGVHVSGSAGPHRSPASGAG